VLVELLEIVLDRLIRKRFLRPAPLIAGFDSEKLSIDKPHAPICKPLPYSPGFAKWLWTLILPFSLPRADQNPDLSDQPPGTWATIQYICLHDSGGSHLLSDQCQLGEVWSINAKVKKNVRARI